MDLISQCALRVANIVWRPGHGGFAYTVVCKATFELAPEVSPLASSQEPVVLADVYAGVDGALAHASELVPFKKRPEVLLTGYAYAPEGRPATSLTARLAVGEVDKAIQVVGDRHFQLDGGLSEPTRFTRMPLVWERAVGGADTGNPAGKPFGDGAKPDFFGRVNAPNLLPMGQMVTSRNSIVSPIGFAPIAPLWPSRTACLHNHVVGWDPGRWHERPLPTDIDFGYFNAAPADQHRTLPFGDDTLFLENLHPRFATLSTRLTPVSPLVTVDQGVGAQPLQLRCDTLIVDSDRGLAMLVWRAHVLLDHPQRPGRVVVNLAVPQNVGAKPATASPRPGRGHTMSAADFAAVPGLAGAIGAALPFSGGSSVVGGGPKVGGAVQVGGADSTVAPGLVAPNIGPLPFSRAGSAGAPASQRRFGSQTVAIESPLGTDAIAAQVPGPSGSKIDSGFGRDESMTLVPGLVSTDDSGFGREESMTLVPDLMSSALPFMASRGESGAGLPFTTMGGSIADDDDPPTPPRSVGVPPPNAASRSMALSFGPAGFTVPLEPPPDPPPVATGGPPPPVAPPLVGLGGFPLPPSAPVSSGGFLPFSASPPEQGPLAPLVSTPLEEGGFPALVPAVGIGAPSGFAPPPSTPSESPSAPPLLGALASLSPGSSAPAAGDTERPPPPETAPVVPHPQIAFEDYPPARCGKIAARIACDESKSTEFLKAEQLNADTWKEVHEHWLARIQETASRSRKLLSEYDLGYVAAVEAHRGAIALSDYAQLAEASERSAAAEVFAELRIPEVAWPHIHRVWLGRMAKDVTMARLVRAAIDSTRAAG